MCCKKLGILGFRCPHPIERPKEETLVVSSQSKPEGVDLDCGVGFNYGEGLLSFLLKGIGPYLFPGSVGPAES